MRGFRAPEDFFLHLGHALVAAFHGQVAARDHHARRWPGHGGEHQLGQVLEAAQGLDLQHHADLATPERLQGIEQLAHVVGSLHERQAHQVGHTGHGLQVLQVFVGERGQVEFAVGEVDALVGHEFFAAVAGCDDLQLQLAARGLAHHGTDAPVVKPDALADAHLADDLRQGAGDAQVVRVQRQVGIQRLGGEGEAVALVQADGGRQRRDAARVGGVHAAAVRAPDGQRCLGREVAGLHALGHHAVRAAVHHQQAAFLAARVGQVYLLAHAQTGQPVGVDLDAGLRAGRRGEATVKQAQAPGPDGKAEFVAQRPQLEHGGAGRQRAGADLGAAQVHEDLDLALCAFGRAPHPPGHGFPGGGVVVGAVDAGHIHAGLDQAAHHGEVGCGLAGQGDHDAHAAVVRHRAQQGQTVAAQQRRARDAAHRLFGRAVLPRLPGQAVQDAQHLVHIGQHMRFGPAQRGHAQPGQPGLQLAQIGGAQGQKVHQVAGAVALVGRHARDRVGVALFALQEGGAQCPEPIDQRQADAAVPRRGNRLGVSGGTGRALFDHVLF